MKSKAAVILGITAVALGATFLMGADPARRVPGQWEYGRYVASAGYYDWQEAQRRVQATNPTHFFERMGWPTGTEVNSPTGRVPALVLNYLGHQGWELVELAQDEVKRDVYWFKRPK